MSLFGVCTESERMYEFPGGGALCPILRLHLSAKPVDQTCKQAIVFLAWWATRPGTSPIGAVLSGPEKV